MGCAAAYHLAKLGTAVTLIEQFRIGHTMGSSHGPTRIIRLAYDGLDYVHLARESFHQWSDLQLESGTQLILKTGGLDLGSREAMYMDGILRTFDAAHVPYEILNQSEIAHRYPQFRLPEDVVGIYQADWSMLSADQCVATLASQAVVHGAKIIENEPVVKLHTSSTGVEVITRSNKYSAKKVVMAAGSWSAGILAQIGIELPLTVLKEQVSFFEARDPAQFQPVTLPLVIHHFPGTTSVGSVFPIHNHTGVKLMLDRVTPGVDPNNEDRTIDQARVDQLRNYAAKLLPGLTGRIIESVSCRYAMTPDEDFIIDAAGENGNVVVASPCSSHGFKFGVVIGAILAELVTNGATRYPIQRFRLDRPGLKGGTWQNKGAIPVFI